jgi:hypothetical protein
MLAAHGDRAAAALWPRIHDAPTTRKNEGEMCFSATASFTMAGILTSVAAVAMARRPPRAVRLLAVMPLLLAAQQATEGIVWLTVGQEPRTLLHAASVVVFLGFALVVWPTWLPLALFLAERDEGRRRTLKKLALLGAAVSACALSVLLLARPSAAVAAHCMSYEYGVSDRLVLQIAYILVYMAPIVVPFFVSTVQLAKVTGAVLLLALIATIAIKRAAFASVWCFFAALLSVLLVIGLSREQRLGRPPAARAKPPLPAAS